MQPWPVPIEIPYAVIWFGFSSWLLKPPPPQKKKNSFPALLNLSFNTQQVSDPVFTIWDVSLGMTSLPLRVQEHIHAVRNRQKANVKLTLAAKRRHKHHFCGCVCSDTDKQQPSVSRAGPSSLRGTVCCLHSRASLMSLLEWFTSVSWRFEQCDGHSF